MRRIAGVVGARQRVVVDDAVDRLVLVLEHHVVADRAQVVAEVDEPGRLDAREDPRSRGGAAVGAGAGASSTVIGAECTGWPRRARRGPRSLPSPPAHHPVTRGPVSIQPLRVGVIGAGTVGREVVRAFLERSAAPRPVRRRAARPGRRSPTEVDRAIDARDPRGPADRRARPTWSRRRTIDVVVETMGGDEPARTLIVAGARHGQDGRDREQARGRAPRAGAGAARPRSRTRRCASRPPWAAASRCSARSPWTSPRNRISRVRGIVNGTTNFMLTAMAREGRDYEEVLAEAQARGYAEPDPTADVEGLDAVNKLVDPRPARVRGVDRPRGRRRTGPARRAATPGAPGITGVTADDVAAWPPRAGRSGSSPRHGSRRTGRSRRPSCRRRSPPRRRSGGATACSTGSRSTPCRVGRVAFEGPGAGGAATSSAVLGDLVAIARGLGSTWAGLASATGRSGLAVRPVAGECVAAPSGACYPVGD